VGNGNWVIWNWEFGLCLIINNMFYIRMLPDLLPVGVSVLGSITLIL
jgi:hypothetical protein